MIHIRNVHKFWSFLRKYKECWHGKSSRRAMLFKQPFLASFFVIAAGTNLCVASISDTQDDLIAWVETQKTISETKAEWASEKVIVGDLIELLKVEKEKYETSIEALDDTSDATDAKRSELNEARDRLLAANEALESVIPGLEDQVRELITKLPTPLVEELDQLIRRMPESGAETRMQVFSAPSHSRRHPKQDR